MVVVCSVVLDGINLVGLGLATNGLGLNNTGVDGLCVVDETVLLKSGLAVESTTPVTITPSCEGSWTITPKDSFLLFVSSSSVCCVV